MGDITAAFDDTGVSPRERRLIAAERQRATSRDKGHGRIERRTLISTTALNGYLDWPGVEQVFKVERRRTIRGRTTMETAYGITSLPRDRADAKTLLKLSRGHWGIENRLFHVTDDSFGEDRHVLQSHAAGATMSLLRTAALNLLRGEAALWTEKTPMTARAEWVNGHPSAVLAAVEGL